MAAEKHKIIIIGDPNVGKTSILLRFIDNKFLEQTQSSIGADFKTKTIEIDKKMILLAVYDTAGQEKFKMMTYTFYADADGILIVYDISDKESFENIKNWLQEADRYAPANVPKIIVGNKTDLSVQRKVDITNAKEFADSLSIPYIETCAKTGENVENAFYKLLTINRAPTITANNPSKAVESKKPPKCTIM